MAVFPGRRRYRGDPVDQDFGLVRKQQIGGRPGGAGEDLQRPPGPAHALQGAGRIAQRRCAFAGTPDDHIATPEPLDQAAGGRLVEASTGEALPLDRVKPAEAVSIEGLAEKDAVAVEGGNHIHAAAWADIDA